MDLLRLPSYSVCFQQIADAITAQMAGLSIDQQKAILKASTANTKGCGCGAGSTKVVCSSAARCSCVRDGKVCRKKGPGYTGCHCCNNKGITCKTLVSTFHLTVCSKFAQEVVEPEEEDQGDFIDEGDDEGEEGDDEYEPEPVRRAPARKVKKASPKKAAPAAPAAPKKKKTIEVQDDEHDVIMNIEEYEATLAKQFEDALVDRRKKARIPIEMQADFNQLTVRKFFRKFFSHFCGFRTRPKNCALPIVRST